jgi:hypothetical protein
VVPSGAKALCLPCDRSCLFVATPGARRLCDPPSGFGLLSPSPPAEKVSKTGFQSTVFLDHACGGSKLSGQSLNFRAQPPRSSGVGAAARFRR